MCKIQTGYDLSLIHISLHVQSVLLGPKMRLCCLLSPSNQKLGAADWERILYVHWLQAFRPKPFIFSGLLAKTKNFINRSALQGTVGLPNYLYKMCIRDRHCSVRFLGVLRPVPAKVSVPVAQYDRKTGRHRSRTDNP